MNQASLKKFLQHPDKDYLISKLIEGATPKELYEWLAEKYVSDAEKRFVLSEDLLKTFKDKNLDFYVTIRNDVLATKGSPESEQLDKAVQLSLGRNKKYKERLLELTSQEIDIKQKVKSLVNKIELRAEQVFDQLQENDPDDFKDDHTLIKWLTLLMESLDKCNKIVNEAPDHIVQHQHTVQITDQQISMIIDTVREILIGIDYEASLLFMERWSEKIGALKAPEEFKPAATEVRLAEAKMLDEAFDAKLNKDKI